MNLDSGSFKLLRYECVILCYLTLARTQTRALHGIFGHNERKWLEAGPDRKTKSFLICTLLMLLW